MHDVATDKTPKKRETIGTDIRPFDFDTRVGLFNGGFLYVGCFDGCRFGNFLIRIADAVGHRD